MANENQRTTDGSTHEPDRAKPNGYNLLQELITAKARVVGGVRDPHAIYRTEPGDDGQTALCSVLYGGLDHASGTISVAITPDSGNEDFSFAVDKSGALTSITLPPTGAVVAVDGHVLDDTGQGRDPFRPHSPLSEEAAREVGGTLASWVTGFESGGYTPPPVTLTALPGSQ